MKSQNERWTVEWVLKMDTTFCLCTIRQCSCIGRQYANEEDKSISYYQYWKHPFNFVLIMSYEIALNILEKAGNNMIQNVIAASN